ncbi:MAG: RluA family pseudouridine synthase [Pirellulales bacterium]
MTHLVEQPVELLEYLSQQYPTAKKTTLRQWLKFGSVHVNNRRVTHTRHPLQPGDEVSICSKEEARAASKIARGLEIVYEDDALIVIDKPANLLSMASDAERQKTAYAMLTDYVRRGQAHSPHRIWIVHRLDKETSGLMVFAKSEAAKVALQDNWAHATKKYLAVVSGQPATDEGTLRSHLDESDRYLVRSAPPSDRTREAITHYRVVRRGRYRALLECTLITGRRHQIRVQLADVKLTVVGDQRYQKRKDHVRRLALHSSYLEFDHPETGERLSFHSHLPGELARLI